MTKEAFFLFSFVAGAVDIKIWYFNTFLFSFTHSPSSQAVCGALLTLLMTISCCGWRIVTFIVGKKEKEKEWKTTVKWAASFIHIFHMEYNVVDEQKHERKEKRKIESCLKLINYCHHFYASLLFLSFWMWSGEKTVISLMEILNLLITQLFHSWIVLLSN